MVLGDLGPVLLALTDGLDLLPLGIARDTEELLHVTSLLRRPFCRCLQRIEDVTGTRQTTSQRSNAKADRRPKTEHHDGGESRVIPLIPELRPFLKRNWAKIGHDMLQCPPERLGHL